MDEFLLVEELAAAPDAAETAKAARKRYSRMGFALLLIMGCWLAMQTLLFYLAERFDLDVRGNWLFWALNEFPLYLIAIPAGLLLMRKAPRDGIEGSSLGFKRFLTALLVCFPILSGGNVIGALLMSKLSDGSAENPLMDLTMNNNWLGVVVMVVLAPLFEEFVFRRQLIDRTRRFGERQAIVFSALCFGLFHMNLYQFFYAFGLGLVFGYVYTRTGRLRYSVVLHMIVNFSGAVVAPMIIKRSGILELADMDVENVTEEVATEMMAKVMPVVIYGLCLIVLCIVGLVLLIAKLRKLRFLPAEEEMPRSRSFSIVYLNVGVILFVLACLAVVTAHLLL